MCLVVDALVCPLLDDLATSLHTNQYSLAIEDCTSEHSVSVIKATSGVLSGLTGSNNSEYANHDCRWRIVVPKGRFIVMVANMLGPQGPCSGRRLVSFEFTRGGYIYTYTMHCFGRISKSPEFYLQSNTVEIVCTAPNHENQQMQTLPQIRIEFRSTKQRLWTQMTPVMTSVKTGFVTSPGFDVTRSYGPFLDAWCNVTIPVLHAVMVSFPHFALLPPNPRSGVFGHGSFVRLFTVDPEGLVEKEYTFYRTGYISPRLLYSEAFAVRFVSGDVSWDRDERSGMNMSFSFHPRLTAPSLLVTGFFNCSVPHYPSFQQHVHCNLQQECEGDEDEGAHCSFSSAPCKGQVAAEGKCYFPVDFDHSVSHRKARSECQKRGADLAMMKTPSEWEAFWKIPHITGNWKCAYIGLHLNPRRVHPLYRQTWMWLDGSPSFDVNVTVSHTSLELFSNKELSVMADGLLLKPILGLALGRQTCSRLICQTKYNDSQFNVEYSPVRVLIPSFLNRTTKDLGLVRCPVGHFVHSCLACYTESHCGVDVAWSHCTVSVDAGRWALNSDGSIVMFACADKRRTLPYSLVCDFRHDCLDHSDESFCLHSQSCSEDKGYLCTNGHCIPFSHKCDRKKDCVDGSDERECRYYSARTGDHFIFLNKKSGPFVVRHTHSGAYEQRPISSLEPCPDNYFRCPSSGNCLPVYLRCNDVHDCPQSEDEHDCENFTCPGFYKCRGSGACVHVTHVCDDLAQCPMKDDEVFCDRSCPYTCHCQGWEMICRGPFDAGSFSYIRYLDARHSLTVLSDLASNTYLVYLNLAMCRITQIGKVTLPNLQVLDLSGNSIRSIDMDIFLSFKQLHSLYLMGNPLTVITGGHSDEHHSYLRHIDLSHTRLSVFTSEPLQRFFALTSLNISFCNETTVTERAFWSTPTLQQIDLRETLVEAHSKNLFKSLVHLKIVYTSNYKLCCTPMLPETFMKDMCFSPQDELSSCEDLLRSDLYRVFLWLTCIVSLIGNLGCLCFRTFALKNQSASGFSVFVSSLSLADCFMGVYLTFVGVADQVFRGYYYLYEDIWISGVPCSVAGAMSLLSSEVSAITICCITLDRFLVLRYPFSTLRFSRRSARVACVLTWLVGFALSLLPLLVPHWEFYRQTGICIPLPVTRQEFNGHAYSFGLMIIFNFILFLMIAAGQLFIYNSVRVNTMKTNTSQEVHDITIARRLLTVAVSDFLCWFPIGMLGLLAAGGIPISGEVTVAMAIFVLPLNSALNPFLYTFNIFIERRRKEKDKRILKYLESLYETPSPSTNRSEMFSPLQHMKKTRSRNDNDAMNKEDILLYLKTSLTHQLVSTEQVREFLSSYTSSAQFNNKK